MNYSLPSLPLFFVASRNLSDQRTISIGIFAIS